MTTKFQFILNVITDGHEKEFKGVATVEAKDSDQVMITDVASHILPGLAKKEELQAADSIVILVTRLND